jgi:hypothetical protein
MVNGSSSLPFCYPTSVAGAIGKWVIGKGVVRGIEKSDSSITNE